MKIRDLTKDEVTFKVSIEPEDIPVRGNACAIDPETDKATEDTILAELDRGNVAAWCIIVVRASWNEFSSAAYLGECSYATEKEAIKDVESYDLKDQALATLNEDIQATFEKLSALIIPI